MLTLRLLGEASVWRDDTELVTGWQSRTAEALFLYLACQQKPIARTTLAEFLWAERDSQQSASNLRVALTLLRKLVGEYLVVTRTTVGFNTQAPYWLDTAEFAQRHRALEALLHHQNTPLDEATLAEVEMAVALYQGDFMAGFSLRDNQAFEEWLLLQQERYRQMATQLLRRLVQSLMHRGHNGRALPYADQLIQLNPLNETAQQQKMLLLTRDGQLAAALAQYQTYHNLLAEELGVEPMAETKALAERIRHASQSPRHNLPPTPTTLIGREALVAELLGKLNNPACRVLTLVGTGGVGKTSLALEAVRSLIPTGYFLNGLRFVSLAETATGKAIPHELAVALGLPLAPPQLLAELAEKEMLLLLDNMEQVAEDSDTAVFLADLLHKAPLVKLLVTSRQRLQLHEEQLLPVPNLDVATSAPVLFKQAAQKVLPHFAPTAEETEAIADICQSVAGLPLAIELAAGWLRHMPCTAVATELHHSLALLTSSLRNVPERHRSMTAVFDHSWALLTPPQRQLLARLAIFHGGFTLPAAQAIARADWVDVIILLEQSLVRHEEGRYTLHPLLRQYAWGRLADSGEQAALSHAHAHFWAAYLAEQGDGKSSKARTSIQAELPNLRAAWLWAAEGGDAAVLAQMLPLWHNFFSVESRFAEGITLLQAGWERLPTSPPLPASLPADWLGRMARMHIHLGQLSSAQALLQQAYALLDGTEAPKLRGILMGHEAIITFHKGEFGQAVILAQESLALATAADDLDGQIFGVSFLGSCYKALGQYAEAKNCFTQAVALYEATGDDLGRAMMLNNLGNLAQAQGEFVVAQTFYLACISLFRVQNHGYGAATALANAGRLAQKLGDLEQAEILLQESLLLKKEQKDNRGVVVALIGLADVAVAAANFSAAQQYTAEGMALAQLIGDIKLQLEVQVVQATLAHAQGDMATTQQFAAVLLAHPALTQEARVQIFSLMGEASG
ncbi:MAG: tetratricopeptide repeat protein [Chloroflexi bacterium]|nr:tetratricopeptide repeat protein [Chloroflexota bacterium]